MKTMSRMGSALLIVLSVVYITGCEWPEMVGEPTEDITEEVKLIPKILQPEGKQKNDGAPKFSPYSCLISTLAEDEAGYNYWNQAFWVYFPKPAVEQAEGKTIFKAFSFGSERAGEKAGSWGGRSDIVRVAQCVIPDSKLAEGLLKEQLKKFGKGTWLESRQAVTSDQPDNKGSKSDDGTNSTSDWECGEWYIIVLCQYDEETDTYYNCYVSEQICAFYVYVEGPGSGGGGGGSGFPGDDPGECDPYGTEPCLEDPGGGSSPPPPPPDPCEESDPPAWCDDPCETGNPVIDNLGVQETFEYLIDKSNLELPIGQRTEQGGFITKNPISEELGFIEFPDEWPRFACGINPPSNWVNAVPSNTIAYVHTHPFFEDDNTIPVCGEEGSESYSSGTNIFDIEFLTDIQNHLSDYTIKGYILDGNNIVTFGSLPGTYKEDERCGY